MPRFGLSYEDEEEEDTPYYSSNRATAAAAAFSPSAAAAASSSTNNDYQQHLQGSGDRGKIHGSGAIRGGAAAGVSFLSSVCLSCLGSDGKSWHSLVRDRNSGLYMIESNLIASWSADEEQDDNEQQDTNAVVILTPLPQLCQSVFRVDAPCEILCVEGGGGLDKKKRERYNKYKEEDSSSEEQPQFASLASLCVYASRAVFLLDIVYSPKAGVVNNADTEIPGRVRSMTEPFERHLLDAGYSARIVRVRAAPQRNDAASGDTGRTLGVAVHCPAKCLAMLTEDRESSSNLYQLALLESNGVTVQVPLTLSTEHHLEEERIVDFCFAQCCCAGLSLLASLSILLVKASGDVLAATPIVFDGTIVTRMDFQQALEYLKEAKDEWNNIQQQLQNETNNQSEAQQQQQQLQAAAKWRQCRAAEQYLVDVFPCPSLDARRSYFLTAKTMHAGPEEAASWPVQIQGPILFHSQLQQEQDTTSDPCLALTIESFGNADIVGFAVGRQQAGVDIGVLSPAVLIPRFQLEARRDTYAIDDDVFRYSSWIERVSLGMDFPTYNAISSNARPLRLVRDATVASFLHVVMAPAVCTISTNAAELASRHLMGTMPPINKTTPHSSQVKTNAWTCLTAASGKSIQGAVVTDSANGHTLLVRLADGSTAETNIDEQRYAHDLASMAASNNAGGKHIASSSGGAASASAQAALDRLDAIPPFYESVQPLVKQIQSGLATMGKIVGSETNCRDIAPDTLAVAITVKERCENQIVLPLMQLQQLTASRRVALQQMAHTLQQELESLLTVVAVDLQDRTQAVCARMRAAEFNALTLSQRSHAAVQASHSLGPVITQAEYDFFKFVDLTQAKCDAWDRKAKGLEARVKKQVESLLDNNIANNSIQLNLDNVDVGRFRTLLDQNGEMLKQSRKRLQETERRIQELVRKAGLQPGNEASSRENQSSTGNAPY
jgi:hypothetical protein